MLRNMKFNKLNDIENELINDERISLKTFHILCVIENLEFVYLDKNILFSYPEISIEDVEELIGSQVENSPLNKVHMIHKWGNITGTKK